jgi:hypothetical protein
MPRGRSMPNGSSLLRKCSMARKSSMPKILSSRVFRRASVHLLRWYVSEVKAKEGKPGVEKAKQLFDLFNAYFPAKICLKGLRSERVTGIEDTFVSGFDKKMFS